MRRLPLYIFTENLSFFFKINNALKEKKIRFDVLDTGKVPQNPSLILTTKSELERIKKNNSKAIIIPFSKNQKFDHYLLEVISSYRVGYKDIYSSLTFSVDPGNKVGLMIFLDGYYLDSYCCYKEKDFILFLDDYISYFLNKNAGLHVNFKFGIGVISMTYRLVKYVFNTYKKLNSLNISLIDEFKTSKIKVRNNFERKFSKDEISALLISLREGIAVNKFDYELIFKQIKSKTLKVERWKDPKLKKGDQFKLSLKKIIKRILDGKLNLEESIRIIKEKIS